MPDDLDWKDLTRAAVKEGVNPFFAEEVYVMVVTALAQCADETRAVPRKAQVAFSRAPGKWQNPDGLPTNPPLQVHAKALYDGEWYDYTALLPDEYDIEPVRVLS